jgi:hypothetical protein
MTRYHEFNVLINLLDKGGFSSFALKRRSYWNISKKRIIAPPRQN